MQFAIGLSIGSLCNVSITWFEIGFHFEHSVSHFSTNCDQNFLLKNLIFSFFFFENFFSFWTFFSFCCIDDLYSFMSCALSYAVWIVFLYFIGLRFFLFLNGRVPRNLKKLWPFEQIFVLFGDFLFVTIFAPLGEWINQSFRVFLVVVVVY